MISKIHIYSGLLRNLYDVSKITETKKFKKLISIYPDPRPIVNQYWNIIFQLYIVGPVLYQCILRVCYHLIMCILFA